MLKCDVNHTFTDDAGVRGGLFEASEALAFVSTHEVNAVLRTYVYVVTLVDVCRQQQQTQHDVIDDRPTVDVDDDDDDNEDGDDDDNYDDDDDADVWYMPFVLNTKFIKRIR